MKFKQKEKVSKTKLHPDELLGKILGWLFALLWAGSCTIVGITVGGQFMEGIKGQIIGGIVGWFGSIIALGGLFAIIGVVFAIAGFFTTMILEIWNFYFSTSIKATKIDGRKKLTKPPFSFLSNVAKLLPAKYARNLEQEISDLRIEYNDALVQKNSWRARCIVAEYYVGLSWSAVKWIAERAKELVGFMPKMN